MWIVLIQIKRVWSTGPLSSKCKSAGAPQFICQTIHLPIDRSSQRRCSARKGGKFRKIHRKIPVPGSLFLVKLQA